MMATPARISNQFTFDSRACGLPRNSRFNLYSSANPTMMPITSSRTCSRFPDSSDSMPRTTSIIPGAACAIICPRRARSVRWRGREGKIKNSNHKCRGRLHRPPRAIATILVNEWRDYNLHNKVHQNNLLRKFAFSFRHVQLDKSPKLN